MTKDEKYNLVRRLTRLVRWGNQFEKFMQKCAPGFKQPHEARIYRHFWLEIDDQIEDIAHALGDNRGTVGVFVHSGGYVSFTEGNQIKELNTPTRLVDYFAPRITVDETRP